MAKKSAFNENMAQLEKVFEEYLVKKAPTLPNNVKDLVVQFVPFLAIIGVIFSIPAILALFGLGAFLSATPYWGAMVPGVGIRYYLGILLLLVTTALEVMAIPGLFARAKKGWRMMYYATLVGGLFSLVGWDLGSLVIGLLGLYLLFQVKSYYK